MSRSFATIKKNATPSGITKMDIKYGDRPMLHVVDASNWMCRAYFATQNNTTYAKDGTPTYGVRQFLYMVQDLIDIAQKDPNGCYLAFCFDVSSTDTWRYRAVRQWQQDLKKKYVRQVYKKSSDYKGNRDRTTTQELGVQMQIVRDILESAGYYVGIKKPYECDDIVGTICHRFGDDYLIKLYSRDKDYVQLVYNDNVELIMQAQSNAPERRFNLKTASGYFGVPSKRVTDMLALSGDGSDNIPGFPGLGEKTAATLINKFGSAIKIRKALQTGELKSKAAWAKALLGEIPAMDLDLQMELVTIDRNVPGIPKNISAFLPSKPDIKTLKALQKRLGLSFMLSV